MDATRETYDRHKSEVRTNPLDRLPGEGLEEWAARIKPKLSRRMDDGFKLPEKLRKLSAELKSLCKRTVSDLEELTLGASPPDPLEAKRLVALGKQCHEEGRYTEALEYYNDAIQLDHENSLVFRERGSSKACLARNDEAIEDYNRALKLDPRDPIAYALRGLSKRTLGLTVEALDDLGKAIEVEPRYAFAYKLRGEYAATLGRLVKAVADFDKALEIGLNAEQAAETRRARREAANELASEVTWTIVDKNLTLRIPADWSVHEDGNTSIAAAPPIGDRFRDRVSIKVDKNQTGADLHALASSFRKKIKSMEATTLVSIKQATVSAHAVLQVKFRQSEITESTNKLISLEYECWVIPRESDEVLITAIREFSLDPKKKWPLHRVLASVELDVSNAAKSAHLIQGASRRYLSGGWTARETLSAVDEAIRLAPDNAHALALRAYVRLERSHTGRLTSDKESYNEATRIAREANKVRPQALASMVLSEVALWVTKDLEEAALQAENAIELAATQSQGSEVDLTWLWALLLRSRIAIVEGKHEVAERYLRDLLKAVRKTTNNNTLRARALTYLALCCSADKRHSTARDFLKRAVDADPQCPEAHHYYARTLHYDPNRTSADWDVALREYDTAVRLDSNFADAWVQRGALLIDQAKGVGSIDELKEGLSNLDRAESLRTEHGAYFSNHFLARMRGIAYFKLQDWDAARHHLRQYETEAPASAKQYASELLSLVSESEASRVLNVQTETYTELVKKILADKRLPDFKYLGGSKFSSHGEEFGIARFEHLATGLVFHLIPGGVYGRGGFTSSNERPIRRVTVTPFLLCASECTQAAWDKVMPSNPSVFTHERRPVENVTWQEVRDFCDKTGLRLPSEAEWEFAARGGSLSSPSDASEAGEFVVYLTNSKRSTDGAFGKSRNAFGLRNILGNVWELCEDSYEPNYDRAPLDGKPYLSKKSAGPTARGGGYLSSLVSCRPANRIRVEPASRDATVGFRPAFSVTE